MRRKEPAPPKGRLRCGLVTVKELVTEQLHGMRKHEMTMIQGTQVPLTEHEKQYLQQYLRDLEDAAVSAGSRLTGYLMQATRMAAECNCTQLPLADLIQEANMAVFMAVQEESGSDADEDRIMSRVREQIEKAIMDQIDQKERDDALVDRVTRFEQAVRDINDGEGEQFSIGELAVLLDMDREEIEDILRLTGDDA